mgnify:CR=1 FL=1
MLRLEVHSDAVFASSRTVVAAEEEEKEASEPLDAESALRAAAAAAGGERALDPRVKRKLVQAVVEERRFHQR